MAFKVIVRQRPEGMEAHLATAEMSNDTLQLKLTKDIQNIMSINGAPLNLAQKRTLRGIGTAYEVTDLRGRPQGEVMVTIRREGHLRKVILGTDGRGRFVDGQGDRVAVAMADPLTWGLTG